MSVKAINSVWQHSRQRGGALLVELAIADFADDQGRAWPGIETLARKARMTPRNVNYIIEKKLKPAGLTVEKNGGPHRANLYRLSINLEGEADCRVKTFQGEAHFTERVKPISPNPSLNRHKKKEATESDKPIPDSLSSNEEPKNAVAKHRRGGGILPELQPAVSRVVAKINELGGTHYRDDKPDALRNLIARLNDGRTEAECLAVIESRHAAWTGNEKMLEYFRPSTLFAAAHFEDYLQAAKRQDNGNGHAKPAQVKDLGDGWLEVDGMKISQKDYDRRWKQA